MRGYKYPIIKSIFILYSYSIYGSTSHNFNIVSESTYNSSGTCTINNIAQGFSLTYAGGNTWSIDNVLLIQ